VRNLLVRQVKFWYALTAVFLTLMLAVALNVIYTNRVAAQSNKQWCSIIVTLDNSYRKTPPASETGKKIASDMHRLRDEFKCGDIE
jgi:hypothetical protein